MTLGSRPGTVAQLVAAGVLLACVAVDSGVFGLRTPMWRRQTPQQYFYRLGPTRGAFLWGLDTGLVVTTFRVTSLTWAALAVTLLGLVPWWAGVAYAAGFVLPSAVFVLLVPPRSDPLGPPEPVWLLDRIGDWEPRVRRAAPVLLGAAAAALALSA
ncbi:hypothetical protein HUT06_11205 [Actinomadura sp. NAK00032]|uniref:hypothetical protein n=1 Tax=Actinomadura sp. NAK00032 TaxID=2742128 RepID=UPI00159158D6|nr:hypothetical protein [Actinomadura sp. NAK00032]QKW34523.1 hypothetical protein HUT06_11205 [Actinomadura sp. NAK00032]